MTPLLSRVFISNDSDSSRLNLTFDFVLVFNLSCCLVLGEGQSVYLLCET